MGHSKLYVLCTGALQRQTGRSSSYCSICVSLVVSLILFLILVKSTKIFPNFSLVLVTVVKFSLKYKVCLFDNVLSSCRQCFVVMPPKFTRFHQR